MKKLILHKVLILFLGGLFIGTATLHAHPKHEVRAVWLTTIGGIDWPTVYAKDGHGIQAQQRQLCQQLDQLKEAGINTVLLQTRVRATTIYKSDYEPWDGCLSGHPGVGPGYDALEFAIAECHRRGMELHAWIVTIPVGKWNSYGCRQLRSRYPALIRKIGDEGFMNPESPRTAEYLANVCGEITRRYDVDGIHLDYIRYPEQWRIAGSRSVARQNITQIVQCIHDKVRQYKPWVKLSCSPIGKFDDLARYSSKGWNAYSRVCQDAQGWLREGLMDQVYPMMYFSGNQFYPFAIDWKEHSFGRGVAAGIGVYMLSPSERNWPVSEVQRQLNVCRQLGLGSCFFRTRFLLDNVKGILDYVKWFNRTPALVPPMKRGNSSVPIGPASIHLERTQEGDNLSWEGAKDRSDGPYLLYNVYASTKSPVDVDDPANLILARHPWKHTSIRRSSHKPRLHYAVTAVDRYGNESAPCQSSAIHSDVTHASDFSPILPNDGKILTLPNSINWTDTEYFAICSLSGNIIRTESRRASLDISSLPNGIYMLKSLHRHGTAHRIGIFAIKRHE